MKNINFAGLITNKKVLMGMVLGIMVLVGIIILNVNAQKGDKEIDITYEYGEEEQKLADDVKAYLLTYLDLAEGTLNKIADIAVQNYNVVMASGTEVINDEISQAVETKIKSALTIYAIPEENLTDENMDALSSGITEIIWEHVLIQISESDVAKADEYQQQYLLLTESLQKQIDDLSKKKTRISIQANIVDNTEMTTEELLEKLQGMNDEELASLTNNLGISADQLKEYIENNIANSENNLSDDLNKQMNDLKKELQKEIKTETSNATGKAGVAGKNGSDGKDGQDGKSIFYRYAEDASGRNWSSAPNDKTKYIGIYTGTRASTNPADYSWSKYSGNDGADGQSVFTVFSEDGVQWYHADEMPQGLEIKWMATYTSVNRKNIVDSSDVESTKVQYSNEANAKVVIEDNTMTIISIG